MIKQPFTIEPNKKRMISGEKSGVGIVLFLIAIAIMFFVSPFTVIDTTEQAVVIRLGTLDRTLAEGVHWKTPFIEKVVKFDVTTKKIEEETAAASLDLQDVRVTVAVQYNIDPTGVEALYREYKTNVKRAVIDPAIQDAVKAGTAQFTAEALITERTAVKEAIEVALKERLAEVYVHVSNVDIVNFAFSDSFNRAIEAKVTAEQEADKAENDLERVKFEADQRVATAEAEAEAIRIQANAINSQGGEDYVNLKAIEKWNGALPTQFVPGSAMPFINL